MLYIIPNTGVHGNYQINVYIIIVFCVACRVVGQQQWLSHKELANFLCSNLNLFRTVLK